MSSQGMVGRARIERMALSSTATNEEDRSFHVSSQPATSRPHEMGIEEREKGLGEGNEAVYRED